MPAKYINPFTDFGFKKIFGEEANKDILRDFLNELLKDEQGEIKSITFKKSEHIGDLALDRKAIFDIYCENERGEKFIVEMQKAKHNFFKDRSIFYSTFPIREQAERGDWNYKLNAVYTIALLDFVFDEEEDEDKLFYNVKLVDIATKKIFYDKLTFIYIEMPKFKKSLEECNSHFERWLYVLRNLERLESYPAALQEKIFKKLFGVAELSNLTPDQLTEYDESLKAYRDLKGVLDTAFDDGFSQAVEELKPQLEEANKALEEKEKIIKEEKRRAEEEKRRAEEEKRRAEEAEAKLKKTLQRLINSGMSEEEAKKILDLS